ncbi:MAG: hypothetical protein D6704_04260 [Nitrospirae bacterium]|nr:MAG: hypothetical protein D6704_04260 [Nitrospirota bacterium]
MHDAESTNRYQVAGVDDRERGFTREATISGSADGRYALRFRYERLVLTTTSHASEADALRDLIHQLHQRGYTQLRTRLHFRGTVYLGNQEEWVEYPDPLQGQKRGWKAWIRRLWKKDFGESPG